MSDLIDDIKYGEFPVDKKTADAYSEVFNGSDASKIVVKDLAGLSGYGMYSDDADTKTRIYERSVVIFRIKQMRNGLPTEQEEDEYE